MNNDLISREALKKTFHKRIYYFDKSSWDEANAIIDNAPTVEERPKGEWIDHSEEGYVECPFCEHLTNCEDNIDELHYCWNCGAKMQKGGAE